MFFSIYIQINNLNPVDNVMNKIYFNMYYLSINTETQYYLQDRYLVMMFRLLK